MNRIIAFIFSILFSVTIMAENKKFVLVIDAGHGGHDAGAVGSFSKEKDINLNTALAFGKLVESNCNDVKVIYTRKKDVFIPLHERADIANKNHADVFISIHTNSLPAGHISRGLETYTMGMRRSDEKLSAAKRENSVITIEKNYKQQYQGYDPNSPESAIMFEFMHDRNMSKSVELAKMVQKEVCASAGRPDKGVKQDVFLVLRETSMPACLIELGFISTPDEEKLLNDKAVIQKFARGIYNAFIKYKMKNDVSGKKYTIAQNDEEPQQKVKPAEVEILKQPEAVKQQEVVKQHETAKRQEEVKQPETTQQPEIVKHAEVAKTDKKSSSYDIPSSGRMSRSEAHRLRMEQEANATETKIAVDQQPEIINQQRVTQQDNQKAEVKQVAKAEVKQFTKTEKKEIVKVEEKKVAKTEVKQVAKTEKRETKPAAKPAQTTSPTNVKASELASSARQTAQHPEQSQAQSDKPVYKVQFLTTNKVLRPDSNQLKGVEGASYYRDGNDVKYTLGECSTYQEADKIKKSISDKFPGAFIVPFLGDKRIDVATANKMK